LIVVGAFGIFSAAIGYLSWCSSNIKRPQQDT
jgi:hypothetical protein